ncbi:MAG: hypothetical protein CVT77_14775 [Alphaproteobacteria bacterium HGW-Alphaproteobacteria-16]|nr:MAG: hypothetical protein CVT77_14775 [Alphaproteobacteria bacterium HGW-Alphaproteobacteria-16]
MGRVVGIALLALASATPAHAATPVQTASADGWYIREDFQPVRRIAIRIANDLDQHRRNTPVVITPDQIPELAGAHELTVTLVDPKGEPRPEPTAEELAVMGPHGIRKENNGRALFMQMDDLDKDGVWDELFFQTDLKPRETRTLYLYLGFHQRGWNPHGAAATIGSYSRHMVPFWESGNVGWKLWFADSIDVYGKRKNVLIAPQMLSGNWDGYAVSYIDPTYGSDIMSVDNSFGGGGIGLFETPGSNFVSRPRFSPNADAKERWNTNQLRDTRYSFDVIVNGPLRSMVRVRTMNWNTGKGSYALEQVYTAYANHNYSTAKVKFDKWQPQTQGVQFAAGIRKKEGETLGYRKGGLVVTTAPEAIRNPDDTDSTQNALKVAYAGIGLAVKDSYGAKHVSVSQQQGNEVFRFPHRADGQYEYMIAAGWSEGEVLKTAAEFRDYMIDVAAEYNSPARLAGWKAETRE